MAVSCLPVLVLGMGAALTHLLHNDAHRPAVPGPDQAQDQSEHHNPGGDHIAATIQPGRIIQAEAAATRIQAAGRRVSRRTLRAAGVHASNAELGKLAIKLTTHPQS